MKKYGIIYADPPWSYRVWSKKDEGRNAISHYQTMGKADIQRLPVENICAVDSVLFLWATPPCLEEAMELIKAWGFVYKTIGFTWIKKNKKKNSLFFGLGYYTRANAELCLLATKGKPLKRVEKNVPQVIESVIGKHSEKPNEARKRIIRLFGDKIPRIELFARERKEDFDVWGNEIKDVWGNEIKSDIEL